MQEDPAPTPDEQEEAPDQLPESQAAQGPGHDDDDLPSEDDEES